jgi:hypothetical protein
VNGGRSSSDEEDKSGGSSGKHDHFEDGFEDGLDEDGGDSLKDGDGFLQDRKEKHTEEGGSDPDFKRPLKITCI